MINYFLFAMIALTVWKNKGYLSYSQIFLGLVIAFHYVPLRYMELNYADLPAIFTLVEIGQGIDRVVTTVLFISLGCFAAQALLRRSLQTAAPVAPRSLAGWIRLNLLVGTLIIFNNLAAAYQALTAGYLDIYVGASSLTPVQTITVLPVYVFTMFYLLLNWIAHRHLFSRFWRNALLMVFGVLIVSAVLTGSRSTVIYLMLAVIAVFSSRLRFRIWKYAPHALVIIAGSTLIGVLREGVLAELDFATLLLRPVIELTNTAVVFLTVDSIAGDFAISGSRYAAGLLYLMPVSLLGQFGIVPPELLSQQYVLIVDPGWSEMGGGFGFSILAEIYLLGGQWGACVCALLIGAYLGWIDSSVRSSNIARATLAAALGFLTLFIVRGEIIELYRNAFVVALLYLACLVRVGGR